MTAFLSLMSDIFGQLYKLLIDSKIANILGVNLFWALFGFFAMWIILNVTVFRSLVSPGSVVSVLPRSESPEVTVKEHVYTHHGHKKDGTPTVRHSHDRVYTRRDGSTYTESWDT